MFAKELLRIIFFAIPIGLIVLISFDLAKNVISGKVDDMQKNLNVALKRVVMAVIVFFIPSIVGFAINGLGNNDIGYFNCITNANKDKIAEQEEFEKMQKEEEINNRINQNTKDIDQGNLYSGSNSSSTSTSNDGDTNMKKNGSYNGTMFRKL